jgi:hypothetical protein
MTDETAAPVDLKDFKRRREMTAHEEAREKLRETMWQDLCALWTRYAAEAPKVPKVPKVPLEGGLTLGLSGDAAAVFCTLLEDLVSLAEAQGVDNGEMFYWLCSAALNCKPEGRLRELLGRAINLSEGDEEEPFRRADGTQTWDMNEHVQPEAKT